MDDLAKRHQDKQEDIRAGPHGLVVADLTDASKGSAVLTAIEEARRISRRTPTDDSATADVIRRVEAEMDSYSSEALRQSAEVESVTVQRQGAQTLISDISSQFKDIDAVIQKLSALESNPEVQTALRLARSSLRYTTSRLSADVTVAWVQNNEVESERAALEEVQVRVNALDDLVQQQQQQHDQKRRDRKIAQSTLDLALSKLEGLARTVSDSGVNKETEVQRAIEESEDAYLNAKKRFGFDESLNPSAAEELVKIINDAEIIAKKASTEQQTKIRAKEVTFEKVGQLSARLTTVEGLCDASGPLVGERVQELAQAARQSVSTVVRLSRRASNAPGGEGASSLESALETADQDILLLEKMATTAKEDVASAEAGCSSAREQLDGLVDVLRAARAKADGVYGGNSENVRGIGSILTEAETALKLCRMHALGVQEWLHDAVTAKAFLEDAALKVEMAEEEVDRDVVATQASRLERDQSNAKHAHLNSRHEKVCRAVQHLKTSPPPRLVHAIAVTDKAMTHALAGKHSASSILHLEQLVKQEEDIFAEDVQAAERRLVELEKAATQVPALLQKLAFLDAQVDSAGVHVASLVEAELGEAHRAVRGVELALDADTTSCPSTASLHEVEGKVSAAEQAVATQIRSVANALMAQQEAKSQLGDVALGFEELNESSAVFSAQSDQLHFHFEGNDDGGSSAWNLNSSPCALSMRLITQAIKRSEQLLAHARRRIEVPATVWMEYGPAVAQNALDNAREGVLTAKTVLDSEQAKLDANDLERKNARAKLEDSSQTIASLRALSDTIADSTDVSTSIDAVDGAERAVEVALKILAHGTVMSASAAMEVALRKTSEAQALCSSALNREERIGAERKHVREQFEATRSKLSAAKETATFLDVLHSPVVMDALSAADRALIGVDLVLKCEFGLPMLRKEFQAAAQAVDDFVAVVERDKARSEVVLQQELRKKREERLRHQHAVETERSRAMEETHERRAMQDKLEAAIHRLQLHWPAVIDVQNSMTAAEASVDAARAKLANGGLAAANAAVISALFKVQTLEQTAKSIEASAVAAAEKVFQELCLHCGHPIY